MNLTKCLLFLMIIATYFIIGMYVSTTKFSMKDVGATIQNEMPTIYAITPKKTVGATIQMEVPTIYAITPTYTRLEQKADMTRLSNTLAHITNLHWIVIEDAETKTELVTNFLLQSKLNYTLLNVHSPTNYWRGSKGMAQRNLGLDWISQNHIHRGVVYFMDDDNSYDLRIFEEMRYTEKISVWPVGLVGGLRYESPVVKDGKVSGWFNSFGADRKFGIDMAGFAINTNVILSHPKARFTNKTSSGYHESAIITALCFQLDDLEPRADNCTKVLVWHTKTRRPNVNNEEKFKKLYKIKEV